MVGENLSRAAVLAMMGAYSGLVLIILLRICLSAILKKDIHDIERTEWWLKLNYGCAVGVVVIVLAAIWASP